MKTHTKKEIERVRHTKISKMNFFIVDMIYRGVRASPVRKAAPTATAPISSANP